MRNAPQIDITKVPTSKRKKNPCDDGQERTLSLLLSPLPLTTTTHTDMNYDENVNDMAMLVMIVIVMMVDISVVVGYVQKRRFVQAHSLSRFGTSDWYRLVIIAHIVGGVFEWIGGFCFLVLCHLCHEENAATAAADIVVRIAASVAVISAVFVHIPTGLMLVPKVFGIAYITKIGYIIVGLMRLERASIAFWSMLSSESVEDVYEPILDLWMLLQIAFLVRIISIVVLPTTLPSSGDTTQEARLYGKRGNAIYDPIMYTFSVTSASLLITPFVYPPWVNIIIVCIIIAARFISSLLLTANGDDDDGGVSIFSRRRQSDYEKRK